MVTLQNELANNRTKTDGYTVDDKVQIKLADQTVTNDQIPKVGDLALPFSLPKDDGDDVSLSDLLL